MKTTNRIIVKSRTQREIDNPGGYVTMLNDLWIDVIMPRVSSNAWKIFTLLFRFPQGEFGDTYFTIDGISDRCQIPTTEAEKALEELQTLGIVSSDELNGVPVWRLDDFNTRAIMEMKS